MLCCYINVNLNWMVFSLCYLHLARFSYNWNGRFVAKYGSSHENTVEGISDRIFEEVDSKVETVDLSSVIEENINKEL